MRMRIFMIVLSFLFAGFLLQIQAQNKTDFKAFEFEIGGGITCGSNYGALKVCPGGNMYIEARTNLKNTPWDLGFQLGLGYMNRKDENKISYYVSNKFSMVAFVDYNFRYWDKVAPFAGIGLGRTELIYNTPETVGDDGIPSISKQILSPAVLNPRIGVELFNHMRITAEYKIHFHKGCNWFALNLGVAFGGGKKK